MRVAQLIRELEKHPGNAIVLLASDEACNELGICAKVEDGDDKKSTVVLTPDMGAVTENEDGTFTIKFLEE